MSSALSGFVDGYVLRARVFPATLALLPLTVIMLLVVGRDDVMVLWPVAVSAGAIFFLTHWVRDRGLELERRLLKRWGGWPTTAMLRQATGITSAGWRRRRAQLELATGWTLPPPGPQTNQADADAAYHKATRAWITMTRGKSGSERVQDENVNYGFRRNLLALKPLGLVATVAAIAVDVVGLLPERSAAGYGCLLACIVVAGIWIRVVNPEFVHRQAVIYAERLFEMLEDERLTPQRPQD